jgi:serine/threonine-protein kinase
VVIIPSGKVVTREAEIVGFDTVDVSHAFRAEISRGEAFRVVVRVDENLSEHVEITKQENVLRIGLKPGVVCRGGPITMEALVTMPQLAGVHLSGACRGSLRGFQSAEPLSVRLSGASHVNGSIECGEVRLRVSGASHVALEGRCGDVTIDVSGSSTVDLSDFPVSDARVRASGASKATVHAGGAVDASASGSSHVFILGDPTLRRVSTSGSSSVRRK